MKRWLLVALLLSTAPRAALAQAWEDYDYENLEFRGIGLEFGGIWPADVERTLFFGARADLGLAGPRVRIIPAVRLWSSRLEQEEVDRLEDQILRLCDPFVTACPTVLDFGTVDLSDIELSTEAHYLFDSGFELVPYLGGGLGLHLLNGQGEAIDDTFVEDALDTLAPALTALGGIGLPLGNSVELFAEARYVLVSDIRYASLSFGGMWQLPTPPRPTD